MKTFKIEVQEFLSKIIEIEANDIDDALSRVKETYQNEEIILDSSNYIETEIIEYE